MFRQSTWMILGGVVLAFCVAGLVLLTASSGDDALDIGGGDFGDESGESGKARRDSPSALRDAEASTAAADVIGIVLDAGTGRPIAGAMIEARFESETAVRYFDVDSDASGRFRLDAIPVPAVGVRVEVRAPSYVSWVSEPIDLEDVEAHDLGRIALKSGGSLFGRITTPEGAAVADAEIALRAAPELSVGDLLDRISGFFAVDAAPLARCFSEIDGNYVFETVPRGYYQVTVNAVGRGTARQSNVWIDGSGAPTELDVQVEDGFVLAGRVVDSRGMGLVGKQICVAPDIGSSDFTGLSDGTLSSTGAGGAFSVDGLARGRKIILVQMAPNRYQFARGIETPSEAAEIGIRGEARLAGRLLRGVDRGPVAGKKIVFLGTTSLITGLSGDDGGFDVGLVEQGAYRVSVGVEGLVVAPDDEMLNVAPGENEAEILLIDGTTLAGKVLDQKTNEAVAGARVRVAARFDLESATESVVTDADGAFRVSGVPLRGARVDVQAEGYTFEEVLHSDLSRRLAELAPGQLVEGVVLRLLPRVEIHGRVLGPDGLPVRGARVGVVPSRGLESVKRPHAGAESVTGEDGAYRVTADLAPSVRMRVTHPRFAPVGASLPVTDLQATTLEKDFRLEQTGRIEGYVQDPSGAPVRGVGVVATMKDAAVATLGSADARRIGLFTRSDERGHWRLDLPPGEIGIKLVSKRHHVVKHTAAPIRVRPGDMQQWDPSIVVEVKPFSARIIDPSGRPSPGVLLHMLRRNDDGFLWRKTLVMERGRFSADVPDGRYDLFVVPIGKIDFANAAKTRREWDKSLAQRVRSEPAMADVLAGSTDIVITRESRGRDR